MPLFHFDMFDGQDIVRDEHGTDCPDFPAARRAAMAVLPAIARDAVRYRDQQDFTVLVRDNSGKHVFAATLSLVARDLL